jgi:DNA polymerase-3 subunit beta
MQVQVNSKELAKIINFCSLTERSKTDVDQFIDQMFVEVNESSLTLERYGLSATKISKPLPLVETDGSTFSFQVDYTAFKAIVTKVTSRFENMTMYLKENALYIEAGRIKTNLQVSLLNKPKMEDSAEAKDEICVKTTDILHIISQVRHAAARGDVRYYLNGICFQTDDQANNLLHAIATDGHRLAKGECEFLAHEYEKARSVILSNECVSYLENAIKDTTDEQVVLHLTNTYASVTLNDGTQVKMKVIDGRYPDWKRVVPVSYTSRAWFDRADFTESIRSSITLANPKFKGGRFVFTDENCELNTENAIGSYDEVMEIVDFDGNSCEVGFNLEYMLSALNVIEDEKIVIRLNGSNGSAVIHGESGDNTSCFHVIMPMRL